MGDAYFVLLKHGKCTENLIGGTKWEILSEMMV
jgi:hypothetical protein